MQCKKCGIDIKTKYNKQYICGTCYYNRVKSLKDKKKKYVYDYLSSHPCEHCGENRPVCLEFHHKNGGEKEFSLANSDSFSISNIEKEINKCIILCANCHKVVTAKELGRYNFLNKSE